MGGGWGRGGGGSVFFFKQKAAYEIKECDWSSDVCSSDLYCYCSPSYQTKWEDRWEVEVAQKENEA